MDTLQPNHRPQSASSTRIAFDAAGSSRNSSFQAMDGDDPQQEARIRALVDHAVHQRMHHMEKLMNQQIAKLADTVKAALEASNGDVKAAASAAGPMAAPSAAPKKEAPAALGKGAKAIADTVKRAMQRLEEKREQGLVSQPSLVKTPNASANPTSPFILSKSTSVAALAPKASTVKASPQKKKSDDAPVVEVAGSFATKAALVSIDGKDYGEASLINVGQAEISVDDEVDASDKKTPGSSNAVVVAQPLKRPATPVSAPADTNGPGDAPTVVEPDDKDAWSDGAGPDDEEDADPEPLPPVAAPPPEPEVPWLSRGLSETHPVITIADVTFVTQGVISCMLCVMQIHSKSSDFREGGAYHLPMVGYNAFAELFTVFWVLTRLVLSKRRGEWQIIDDLPGIREEYMKTWLAYDLIYALPVDFIFSVWNWEAYRWIQLRHFLRLPRMFALGNSHNPLLSSRLWFRFLSFVFWMLLTMHFLACIFWALENVTYDESIYWAVATMTSVGYGDIVPTYTASRIYVCFAMLFGIGMLSTMTAFATTFLTQQDKLTEEREAKKQMMYSMLEYYDIPWEVQREVIAAVPAMLENDNEQKFKEMNAQLPPFVAKKIDSYIRAKMLGVVPLFKRIENSAVLLELSAKLRQQFYPAGEPIIEQGATDRDMYFLVKGVVEVVVLKPSEEFPGEFDAVVVAVLQTGAFFGEVNLLRGGTRGATVRPMTLCEVLALSQPDFESFMNAHPSVRDLFADQLTARVQQVAKQNEENKVDEALAIITGKGQNQTATAEDEDAASDDDDDEEPMPMESSNPLQPPPHPRRSTLADSPNAPLPLPVDVAFPEEGRRVSRAHGSESPVARLMLRDLDEDRRRSSPHAKVIRGNRGGAGGGADAF